ncbi:MAG: RluA family pseudouridine synthase, partial [Synergistaceae bacterium]|nr:RluA family pseudouridine synthase [Synergistaceae bacterium]
MKSEILNFENESEFLENGFKYDDDLDDDFEVAESDLKNENEDDESEDIIEVVPVVADEDFERLDKFLAEKLEISRTRAATLIRFRKISLDGETKLKSSQKVQTGEKFLVNFPRSKNEKYLRPEPVDFETLYEDENIIVISKPSGVVVHPSPGNWRNTLVNGLVYRYPDLKKLEAWLRPGIVHRLDATTSGLMVVARTEKATIELQRMFKDREIDKHYIALAHGRPERLEGIISGPIDRDPDNYLKMAIVEGGKPSLTGYKVLWTRNNISMVEFKLYTGRTHQIRVHFSTLGCPLVGDWLYGANEKDSELGRVFLHSWRLSFKHPITGEQ